MSADKASLVEQLFQLLGGQPMVEEAMRRTLRAVASQMGDDGDFWKELEEVMAGDQSVVRAWREAMNQILDQDDLEVLVGFYATPAGQKLAAATPRVGDIAPRLLMDIDGMIRERVDDLIQRARKSPAP